MTNDQNLIWSEQYRIGDERIDKEHQYLFEIQRQIADINPANTSADTVRPILNELLDYTQIHFRDEELLMRRIKYSDYELHIKEHMTIVRGLEDLMEEFKLGYSVTLVDILRLLEDWIVNHTLSEDMKLAKALTEFEEP